jgi:hypothetical protein
MGVQRAPATIAEVYDGNLLISFDWLTLRITGWQRSAADLQSGLMRLLAAIRYLEFLWLRAKPLQSQQHAFWRPPCTQSYMAYESLHG